jgi:hypothetical protein
MIPVAARSEEILAARFQGFCVRIPVAERSKVRVCGRWLAGVAGLNSAGGVDVYVACLSKD